MIFKKEKVEIGCDKYHYSKSLKKEKCIRIYKISRNNSNQYTLFVLLHAFAGNRLSWLATIKWDELYLNNAIFVFPESGRRWFINDDQGNKYEEYIILDLMPFISEQYKNIEWTAKIIGGFSLGGACSLFLGLRHARLFTHIFSYAGAFQAGERFGDPYKLYRKDKSFLMPTEEEHTRVWGQEKSETRTIYNIDNIIKSATTTMSLPDIYLSIGINDYPRILKMNRETAKLLEKNNIYHRYVETAGEHSWKDAAKALQIYLSVRNGDEKLRAY